MGIRVFEWVISLVVVLLCCVMLLFGFRCYNLSIDAFKQDSITSVKLEQSIEGDYTFIVDGVKLSTIDECTIAEASSRYNVVFDDKSNTVVMTTK